LTCGRAPLWCPANPPVSAPLEPSMAKSNTLLIKLISSADTGYYYVTKKNPRKTTDKLELKKYDPVARKHVLFREGKIK
jgi:large subunit ribosomal protein L33